MDSDFSIRNGLNIGGALHGEEASHGGADHREWMFSPICSSRAAFRPDHIRSDNGSEFTAKSIKAWLPRLGVKTLYIEPGSPWENVYDESFNGRFRDEFLNGEIFYTLRETQVLTEEWRHLYNYIRPHTSLGYKPPAPLARAALEGKEKEAACGATAPLPSPLPRHTILYQLNPDS